MIFLIRIEGVDRVKFGLTKPGPVYHSWTGSMRSSIFTQDPQSANRFQSRFMAETKANYLTNRDKWKEKGWKAWAEPQVEEGCYLGEGI